MGARVFCRFRAVAVFGAMASLFVAGCSRVVDFDESQIPDGAADAVTDGSLDSVVTDTDTTDAVAADAVAADATVDVKGETSSSDVGVDSASSADSRIDATSDASTPDTQGEGGTDAQDAVDAQAAVDAADVTVDSGPTQTFMASLTPLQEVQSPPVSSTASGRATCTLSGDRAQLRCVITHTLAAVTSGHLHAPAGAGQGAGAVAVFVAPFSSPTTQIFGLTAQNATDLEAGRAYLNLHTSLYPAAEIRGQLIRPGEELHSAQLTGTAAGRGYVGCILGANATSLRCSGGALGLANPATSVELIASDGTTVVTTFTIVTAGTDPKFSGTVALSAAQLATYLSPGWSVRITANADVYSGTLAKQ